MRRKKNTQNKSTGKEIFVNVGPVEKRIAIIENGKLVDYFMDREGLEHYAGSIYVGKVSSIVKGIEAAFIEIGLEKNGFLHLSDFLDNRSGLKELLPGDYDVEEDKQGKQKHKRIQDTLKVGQNLMVQVVKEGINTKGPRVTTQISLAGRYIVLTPFESKIGISRRIKDRDERKRIRDLISNIRPSQDVGFIVRTMSENIKEKELKDEVRYLTGLWDRIQKRSSGVKDPIAVYEEYGVVLRMVRDKFTEDVARLVVDSKEEYARIMKFLRSFRPELRKKVKFYKGKTPLFQKYGIEKDVDSIFERRVSLRSGGNIVIEQTEGMVAIDVNTGKFTGKRNLEETVYKTNMEAAEEIPRQLVLRDIGGIVIIDFIDMESRKNRESIFNKLQNELKRDKARISVRSISQFGIVEMTRQRMRKSLESTSHITCPCCGGKGVVKSVDTIAIETVRKIDKVLSDMTGRNKHIQVVTHPEINVALMSNQAKLLSDIQKKYKCRIDLNEDLTFPRDHVYISGGS